MTPVEPGGVLGETIGVDAMIVEPLVSVVVYTVKLVDCGGESGKVVVFEVVKVEPLESVVA